ncbi:MAG TPA: nucleotidyl transferase AbiEii/AbiGii toxin family protein [Kofleriaceae bacterium]|nr:nucleotidyl transferase AbiEii/AbiGii toxin family protein [Kofleriaceae bacterium]
MTRTWPSTAAGTDHAAALAGWLRRARGGPPWVVRGSIVTAALCPGARPPADVDYLAPGDGASFDAAAMEREVRAIAAVADELPLEIEATEVIWAETATPGLRARVRAGTVRFQIDLAVGDPMCVPPRPISVAGVGDVLACAPETLFGWKLHGLCEFGPGRWRAKDLFDLDLLWRHAGLDLAATRAAVELAFGSRALPLAALDDFRTRDTWGRSRGGVRKWRALAKAHAAVDDFFATRARVRAAVDALLGPREPG